LLGLPTGGSFDLNATQTAQNGYYAIFFHDDFRLRTNLTLNLGIRYERDLPTTERFNRSVSGFDFNSPSQISAQAAAAYARNPIPELAPNQFKTNGGLLFAGPGNRDLYETKARYFSPRFGFAWKPQLWGGKTVVRGGTGVFIFPIGMTPNGLTGVIQTGFSQSTQVVPTLNSYLTPAATLSNPFPNGIEQPTGSTLGLATFLGRAISFNVQEPANAYSVRWNLDLQRQLPGNTVLEAGYIGNHSVHLRVDSQLDFVARQYLSTSPVRDQTVIDRLTANVVNPLAGLLPGTNLNGSTIQRQLLLDPFPHLSGVTALGNYDGSSHFHMLQVRVEKRFSHGFQFLGNYLYSKLIEKRSRLNNSDPYLEKRIADEDRPQRLVVSASWELPFGKRKPFGSALHPVWQKVIGGWTVNTIYTTQPGQPLSWGNVIYYGGDLRLDPRRIDGAFDTTRFNTNSQQQLASNVRTFPTRFANLRADGANNIDFSVIKETQIREKLRLQYRCEFFNFFNHPSFNAPELSPTNSNFGRITSQANLPRSTQMALRLVW